MYWGVKRKYVEYIIYTLFWGILIILPFMGELINGNINSLNWSKVLNSWLFITPAFLLFVINNNILMPYFLYKKGRTQYVIFLILATVLFYFLFVMVQNSFKGDDKQRLYWDRINPRYERMVRAGKHSRTLLADRPGKHLPPPPKKEARAKFYKVKSELYDFINPNAHKVFTIKKSMRHHSGDFLFSSILHPYSVQFLLILFVLMFNISIRILFYTIRNDERLKELEQQKLKSELEYLKFQINPHFFMNTLNNIHALIDIDKESAQKSIIELAKMMRYVLYESPEPFVSLDKELQMVKSYISLMRLRYTDMLKIEISLPNDIMGATIPSLMLMSFVENAFKHGISYNNPSEVHVSVSIDDANIVFSCRNTINNAKKENEGSSKTGIGIENTRKRLQLLYGGNYVLRIWTNNNYYNVLLKIPVTNG